MYKLKCENYNNLQYIYIHILKYTNPKNIYVHIYTLKKNVALKSLRLIDVNFK